MGRTLQWLLLAVVSLTTLQCGESSSVGPSPPLPQHRIATRVVGGLGELYDRTTGLRFAARGNNYVRLAPQVVPGGQTVVYHSTFNPGLYDPAPIEAALTTMQADGYNVVRVWINHCCATGAVGDPAGGISAPYVANVADFVSRARARAIYTILTVDDVPKVGGYTDTLLTSCCVLFNGDNMHYLSPAGLKANQAFWHDFVQALLQQHAPVDAILAYELRNEFSYASNLPPLSLSVGHVATANGLSYDLADSASRQQMMDDNMVYWADQIRVTIRALDATALVAVGFFQPQTPNATRIGDPRVTRPYPAIAQSTTDVVDLHAYPGLGLTMAQYAENYALAGFTRQPVILGEFGAPRSVYGTTGDAANAVTTWQIASCGYGFGGWLAWTWDLEDPPDYWSATSGDSAVDKSLSPVRRGDPCAM